MNPRQALLLVVMGATLGCDRLEHIGESPEERINAAMPVSAQVQSAQKALFEKLATGQAASLQEKFAAQMKIRALECSLGYKPAALASAESIRAQLTNSQCFRDQDARIGAWLNAQRIRLALSETALRPIPATIPPFIVADADIHEVNFARDAGIALLNTAASTLIVDLGTGEVIFREARSVVSAGSLSPNGRLFVSGDLQQSFIRDTTTGDVLAEVKDASPYQVYWLDNASALVPSKRAQTITLMDFESGTTQPVTLLDGGIFHAVALRDSQILLFGYRSVAKVAVRRDAAKLSVELLAEQPIGNPFARNTGGLSSDGSRYVDVGRGLTVIDCNTFEITHRELTPLSSTLGVPAREPDKFIVRAYVGGAQKQYQSLQLSTDDLSLAVIDKSKLLSDRFEYVPSLAANILVAGPKLVRVDALVLSERTSLASYARRIDNEALLQKAEAIERMRDGTPSMQTMAGVDLYPGPVSALAANATVEGVGVYQATGASRGFGQQPKIQEVRVRVRRSDKPLVLVLSSYEAVGWRIMLDPGARLNAVLLSGYHDSSVMGIGNAKLVTIGRHHAYSLDGPEFAGLSKEVYRWTGKAIGVFQGRYEGADFTVGT